MYSIKGQAIEYAAMEIEKAAAKIAETAYEAQLAASRLDQMSVYEELAIKLRGTVRAIEDDEMKTRSLAQTLYRIRSAYTGTETNVEDRSEQTRVRHNPRRGERLKSYYSMGDGAYLFKGLGI